MTHLSLAESSAGHPSHVGHGLLDFIVPTSCQRKVAAALKEMFNAAGRTDARGPRTLLGISGSGKTRTGPGVECRLRWVVWLGEVEPPLQTTFRKHLLSNFEAPDK